MAGERWRTQFGEEVGKLFTESELVKIGAEPTVVQIIDHPIFEDVYRQRVDESGKTIYEWDPDATWEKALEDIDRLLPPPDGRSMSQVINI